MLRANLRLHKQQNHQEPTPTSTPETTEMSNETSKKGLIVLFERFEEIELVTTLDMMRRSGMQVYIATINQNLEPVEGCNRIFVKPDVELLKFGENNMFDVIVIPGGPGFESLTKVGIMRQGF